MHDPFKSVKSYEKGKSQVKLKLNGKRVNDVGKVANLLSNRMRGNISNRNLTSLLSITKKVKNDGKVLLEEAKKRTQKKQKRKRLTKVERIAKIQLLAKHYSKSNSKQWYNDIGKILVSGGFPSFISRSNSDDDTRNAMNKKTHRNWHPTDKFTKTDYILWQLFLNMKREYVKNKNVKLNASHMYKDISDSYSLNTESW